MPRARKPQAPGVRSDGAATRGNISAPGQGQPNGNRPRSAVTQVLAGAGAGGAMPYGMKGQLQSAAAQMPPPPPGISPETHSVALALKAHRAANPVTPLFAPSSNPAEPVTAGAPLAAGPTHPMAMPMPDAPGSDIATALQQAADASGSPQLRALAQHAQAQMQAGAPSGQGLL